jgi:hypothetical protein
MAVLMELHRVATGRGNIGGCFPRVSLRFTLGYFHVFPTGRPGIVSPNSAAKRTISRYQIVHAIVPLALVRTGAIPPGGDWGYHGRFEAAELATCAA